MPPSTTPQTGRKTEVQYGPLDPARDVGGVARLLHHGFAGPQDKCEQWMRDAGLEHLRVARPAAMAMSEPPPACLLRIPMGQFFGGRSVPMVGIAGVAVGPESRGGGLALGMMQACIREIRDEGVPLSCLYASTQTLYRQVGFEQAGHRFHVTLPIERIGVRERRLTVRALGVADEAAVRACYKATAPATNGMLDRGEYLWQRTRKFRDSEYKGFGVFASDQPGAALEGYLFLGQNRNLTTGRQDIAVSDLAFTTRRGAERLLGFLADFSTMGDNVEFHGAPMPPILHLLPQQRFSVEKKDYWMIRIVDVKGAIEQRGYPAALSCEARIELTDELIAENAGMWTVRVERGRAAASKGGSGAARMDIRTLASLYSGFLTAPEAVLLGVLDAPPEQVDALSLLFNGGTPSMADMF